MFNFLNNLILRGQSEAVERIRGFVVSYFHVLWWQKFSAS